MRTHPLLSACRSARGLVAPIRNARDGQSMVLMAMAMLAMLAMAALMIDGGMAYGKRRSAQNAADAGALAGARLLALGRSDSEIRAAILDYTVTRNGATAFTATYQPGNQTVGSGVIPGGARGVRVTPNVSFTSTFAQFVGFPTLTIGASASASFAPVTRPGPNLQPIARKCDKKSWEACYAGFQVGREYDIWQGGGSGNFGWLSWSGANNSPYVEQMLTPGNPLDYIDPHDECTQIGVGCWVQGLPGVDNGDGVRSQLDNWIALGQQNPPVPMIVVIYDQSEDGGSNLNYHIAGFAAFIITSYDLSAKSITGRFVNWITPGNVDDNQGDFGVVSVHLRN